MVTESILTESRSFYESYYQSFKSEDSLIQKNIDLKKRHTLRVINLMEELGGHLFINKEQHAVGEIIARYHDIGRFAQFTQYQTFNDAESEDHALLSAKVTEDANFFSKINETTQRIILNAIKEHNKIRLQKTGEEQADMFAMLIRDADKLDVLEMFTGKTMQHGEQEIQDITYNLPVSNKASEKIIKCILQEKPAKKEDMQSIVDFKLMMMSWVFDLNFKASFNILNGNRLIEKIYNSLPKQDGIIDAYRVIKLHIENKFVE